MKKLMLAIFVSTVLLPVCADEYTVPQVQSVRYFTRPDMSRLQYSLPEHPNFLRKKTSEVKSSDTDEITLDEDEIKPVKKVIKRMNTESETQDLKQPKNSDVPMNYDSFPKFYNQNDLMNQQFMPTATF